ncbi:EF-hand calcium-binding domain-containing protein 5 [Phyllobates terribilis]|uniref:EF-hand calcium-binding domain-containing protein 5 n=1 Tax=Phyllobates terribilis TaxID=111132 RepID=UPI003CCAB857
MMKPGSTNNSSMESCDSGMGDLTDTSKDSHPTEAEAGYMKIFTDTMQERGLKLQQKTLKNLKKQRDQRQKLEKEAPAVLLAQEWFSHDKSSVDTRAYLLDRLMPSVVHGVESLLKELEKKKVLEDDPVKFDPVNYLGEFLMRHNPGFFSGMEQSAYTRGLEQVIADLKDNVFDLEFNRLGQLKEELKENQSYRVEVEGIQAEVMEKRKGALSLQFQEWTLDVNGRIPLALVQSALKSFFEVISQLAEDNKPVYREDLVTADTMEQKLYEEEFIEYVYPFISHLSTDLFQEFLHHMAQCADMFRETIRHDIWRQQFSDLFLECDSGKVGFLDRQRVLSLLEKFYDIISSKAETWQPRNPRQWPVIEIGEMDPTDFWAEFQEGDSQLDEKVENPTATVSTIASSSGEKGQKDEASEDTGERGQNIASSSGEKGQKDEASEDTGECGQNIASSSGEERQKEEESEDTGERGQNIASSSGEKGQKDEASEDTGECGQNIASSSGEKGQKDEASEDTGECGQNIASSSGEERQKEEESEDTGERGQNIASSSGEKGQKDEASEDTGECGQNIASSSGEERQKEEESEDTGERGQNIASSSGEKGQKDEASEDTGERGQNIASSSGEERQKEEESEDTGERGQNIASSSGEKGQKEEESADTGERGQNIASSSGEKGQKETEPEDITEGAAHREDDTRDHETEDCKSRVAHFIEGKPWSGDLLTSDLAIRYSSYGDRSEEDCRDAVSKFTDLRTIISDINTRGPSRIPSAFNDSALNLPQFVQLMETFVGEAAPLTAVEELTSFIQKEYVETEEERIALLTKVRHEALLARQKVVLQALFEKWDNEGSGFLELEEVEGVLAKYKEGMESQMVTRGRENLSSSKSQRGSRRLSVAEFIRYMQGLIRQLPGPEEEVFESMVEFLTTSVERTQIEKLRGASRRKWLQHIQSVAETSGGRFEPVYKAVFKALYKDAEVHGNNKKISANIALLEQSSESQRWNEVLRYVACTSEDAIHVLSKTLSRDMKGVSFAAVDSGIPQHVPRIQYHGNIQFWNNERSEEERKGSLIILPLMDTQQRVFGTLSIDTVRELRDRNIFLTHEISFYQGVTNAFSTAYHLVLRQRNIVQLVSSALAWIYSRAPNIRAMNTYLMEPCVDKAREYVFRNMMYTDNNTGVSEIYSSPATLRRRDNLFRDYLFKCADSSEVITTDAYGERHIAVPIRDPSGRALGVLDLNTGHCKDLPAHEYQDLQKMLQMLQGACYEILEEETSANIQKRAVLEAERGSGQRRVGVLFHRFMLQDLRQCVSKLDHQSFAELKSYKEPPVMVHSILKAVLLLFCPAWADSEEIHSWNQCKLKVNSDLIRKILSFDPTAQSVQFNPEILTKYIKGIPRGAVWRHGSIPAEHLYNWAFTCLSLMELSQKMQNTQSPTLVSVAAPSQM